MLHHAKTVSPKKIQAVDEIAKVIKAYKCIGFIKLEKIPAKSLHEMRRVLRGQVVIKSAKKITYIRALEKCGVPGIEVLKDHVHGTSALVATNMNPFELVHLLKSKAVAAPAKAGDIAPDDIVVKAGDSKLAPGPIISELTTHLKLPTMIKGTIQIREDTITHHKGDVINEKQAQLLSRLGITPMTICLDFYVAYENGELLESSVLNADFDKMYADIGSAYHSAIALATGLGVITEETLTPIVLKAVRGARAVAMELPIVIPELIEDYFRRAIGQSKYLEASAFGLELAGPAVSAGKADSKSKEPEKPVVEDTGIGGLFD